jgi:TonB family protein
VSAVLSASTETPLPLATIVPQFSPLAHSSGVVLLEARVDRAGQVTDVTVLRSAPPFDDAALRAARQWTFRPALAHGTPAPRVVLILFGFAIPVVS